MLSSAFMQNVLPFHEVCLCSHAQPVNHFKTTQTINRPSEIPVSELGRNKGLKKKKNEPKLQSYADMSYPGVFAN